MSYYYQEREESIFNLLPQPSSTVNKSTIHKSKYPHNTPPTGSTFGRASTTTILPSNLSGNYDELQTTHQYIKNGATLGPKNIHYSDPTSYQKKNSMPSLPQPTRFEYKDRRKAPLDDKITDEISTIRLKNENNITKKNYITSNALAVIMADARRPLPNEIDYLKKNDYGKKPEYLNKIQNEINAEKRYIQFVLEKQKEEQMKYQPKMRLLPEEERTKLLFELKLKWEEVNKQYQTITHIVNLDTTGKIRRKEQYESELNTLEKSIERLSKPYVFVQE